MSHTDSLLLMFKSRAVGGIAVKNEELLKASRNCAKQKTVRRTAFRGIGNVPSSSSPFGVLTVSDSLEDFGRSVSDFSSVEDMSGRGSKMGMS